MKDDLQRFQLFQYDHVSDLKSSAVKNWFKKQDSYLVIFSPNVRFRSHL